MRIVIDMELIVQKVAETNREYAMAQLGEPTISSISEKSRCIGKMDILSWLLEQSKDDTD